MSDDDDGKMIFGELEGLKFPDICLTGEKNLENNLTQETCLDRGSKPGPLHDRRACYRLSHSGGLEITSEFETHSANFPTCHERV